MQASLLPPFVTSQKDLQKGYEIQMIFFTINQKTKTHRIRMHANLSSLPHTHSYFQKHQENKSKRLAFPHLLLSLSPTLHGFSEAILQSHFGILSTSIYTNSSELAPTSVWRRPGCQIGSVNFSLRSPHNSPCKRRQSHHAAPSKQENGAEEDNHLLFSAI